MFLRSGHLRFVSPLSVSGAHRLLLSGVWKPSRLASAYAGTPDISFGIEPFDGAFCTVLRILFCVSDHARSCGTASEGPFRAAGNHLDVVRVYPRLLAPKKRPCLPVLIARSLSMC